MLEIYEYYDQPVLLACRSASDVIYLVVAVDADAESESWLCVAVSQRRFESVRSGAIELRTAFAVPEDDSVIHVVAPFNNRLRVTVTHLHISDVSEEWLPAAGARITLPTDTLPKLAHGVQEHARQTQREILGVKLDMLGTTRNEVPAGMIGRVLQSIQGTIAAIVQYTAKARRQVPDPELMLVAAGGGSFEIRLASAEEAGMLFSTDSRIANATKEFGELVQLADDEEAFRRHVQQLPLPVAGEYLTFLRAIEGRISEATVEWASPTTEADHGVAVIRPADIQTSINAMIDLQETARTFELIGRLIAGHTEKRTYEFVSEETEPQSNLTRFAGTATRDALKSAAFHERYRATFDEIRHMKPTGGVELKYVLKNLRPLTDAEIS